MSTFLNMFIYLMQNEQIRTIFGLNGGLTRRASSASHSISLKKAWDLIAASPDGELPL